MSKKPLWTGKTHGGSLGQKGLFIFFRHLSLPFGYAILAVVVVFYMIFNRKGFKAIWYYFTKIRRLSTLKALVMTYRNHFLFGQALLDKFALFAGKKDCFRITISGQELFEEVIHSPAGAIIASSHVGNFEISGYLLRQDKKHISGIVFGGENPVIQQYRNEILARNNISQIPVAADMSHIFAINAVLTKGGILSMPCDRVFTGNKTVTLDFMGAKAVFPTGAYHLAVKYNVPVLTLYVVKTSMKHYHIHINRIDTAGESMTHTGEKVDAMARNFVKDLEAILEQYPEQWYNFYQFWN